MHCKCFFDLCRDTRTEPSTDSYHHGLCKTSTNLYGILLYTVLYIHYVAYSPGLLSPLLQNLNLFLQLLNSQQVISPSLPFHTYLLLFHVPALLEENALRWFFKQKIDPHHEGQHAHQQNEVKDGFLSEAQTCTWTSFHSGGVVVLLCFYAKCLWMTVCFIQRCVPSALGCRCRRICYKVR